MANVRKKSKRFIGGYVEKEMKDAFKIVAVFERKTEIELLQDFIEEGIDSRLKKGQLQKILKKFLE